MGAGTVTRQGVAAWRNSLADGLDDMLSEPLLNSFMMLGSGCRPGPTARSLVFVIARFCEIQDLGHA